jgi:hypothetical protein
MLRPTCGGEGEKYYQLITSCYLTLTSGKKAYVTNNDMAMVETNFSAQQIDIEGIEYVLMSAEQVNYANLMTTYWPFFYNPETQKAHFIRSVLSTYENSHIFNHALGRYCIILDNLNIEEDLLHIERSYNFNNLSYPSPEDTFCQK